jgi:hypothetical protein
MQSGGCWVQDCVYEMDSYIDLLREAGGKFSERKEIIGREFDQISMYIHTVVQ